MKTWTLINSTRYDIKLSNGELDLTKKEDKEDDPYAAPDDGLILEFNTQKPEHVTFDCKTNNVETESCDLKLFNMDKESSYNQKTKKIAKVS